MYSLKDSNTLQSVLTVSELTAQIRGLLEDVFERIAVVGEISNAKIHPSGHWYFSLKDKEATIPCVCFRNANQNIRFQLEDGLMVVARGKLTVYPPRGSYQLVVTSLEPVGIGQWQLAFDQLKAKLEAEGLLRLERKRAIPTFPRRIAVVTSLAGAAVQDIISALARRNPNVEIVIRPTKVQGEGSAEDIAKALADLQELGNLDVILVARGGGSIEDLWSFNTELVARAVAGSAVPVISGVGHETDTTICDLVADLRAPTPTAAAELVARGHGEILDRLEGLSQHLFNSLEQHIASRYRLLERLAPLKALLRYRERLHRYILSWQNLNDRLFKSIRAILEKAELNWHTKQEKLLALGPINVLTRGFAVVRTKYGQVISNSSQVSPNDLLEILLQHGKIQVRVESIEGDWY